MFVTKVKNSLFNSILKTALRKNGFLTKGMVSENKIVVLKDGISFYADISRAREQYLQSGELFELETLLADIRFKFALNYKLESFQTAQSSLRHLLVREEDLEEGWIWGSFAGGIKKILTFADGENVYPLGVSYLKKWGVPKDVLFAVADRNMSEILKKASLHTCVVAGRVRAIDFTLEPLRLKASFMLCSNFQKLVSEKLGARFLVFAPSQEYLLAVEDVKNNVVESFGTAVVEQYLKSDNKLSTEVFLFSPSGISTAGKFKLPEQMEVF